MTFIRIKFVYGTIYYTILKKIWCAQILIEDLNIKYNLITNIWRVKWWDFKSSCDTILWGETKVKLLWLYIYISWIQVILTIILNNITPLNIFYWMWILKNPLFDNNCILYPPCFKNFKMIKKINNYVIYQMFKF